MMQLPGGVLQDGRLRRDFRFRAVTGEIERFFCESGSNSRSLPEQVTQVLASALDEVGGQQADRELVRSMSVGDRLFLITRLESIVHPGPKWVTASCGDCGELIQFQVDADALPVVEAAEGYPRMPCKLSIGTAELRVPSGADEETVALTCHDTRDGMHELLSRLLTIDGGAVDASLLTEDDMARIDRALDVVSPQVGTSAHIDCPHCGAAREVAIDPYAWLAKESEALDREIHTLAFHYHWSESDILRLPRQRRERYLKLIDENLGKYRADDLIRGTHWRGW
jgi:hypothetical protein